MGNETFPLEEDIEFDDAIRRGVGVPANSPRYPMNFQIPGPPNQAEVDRIAQIRQDTARDMLTRLTGDETPVFLNKLNQEAGFAASNAEAPANAEAGFTAPVAPHDEIFSRGDPTLPMDLGPAAQVAALQPQIDAPPDLQTLFDAEGFPLMAEGDSELAFGGVRDLVAEGVAIPQDPGVDLPNLVGQVGRSIADATPTLPRFDEEFATVGPAIGAAFEGFLGDVDATERGRMIGKGAIEFTSGIGRSATALASDLGVGVAPIFEGIAGVGRGIAEGFQLGEPPIGGGPTKASAGDEPTGSQRVDDHGETPMADNAEKRAEDESRGPLENVGGGDRANPPSFDSGEHGVQSGSAADRIAGPPLRSREERGPGVEVIRGMRRTFQPTDESGRAVGSEIPFGRGTLQRLENLGATFDEAVDFAIRIDEANSSAVRAGAQALIAKANAMTEVVADFNGDGKETRGLIEIMQDGGVVMHDLGLAENLTAKLQILRTPVEVMGQFGKEFQQADILVQTVQTEDGPKIIRLGTITTAEDEALIRQYADTFQTYLDAGVDYEGALQMLRESLGLAAQ